MSLVMGRLNAWTNSVTALEFSLNVTGSRTYRVFQYCDVNELLILHPLVLIAHRIWKASRKAPLLPGNSYNPQHSMHYALRIVIESAVMYCAAEAVLLGCSIAHSNAQYIMLGMVRTSQPFLLDFSMSRY